MDRSEILAAAAAAHAARIAAAGGDDEAARARADAVAARDASADDAERDAARRRAGEAGRAADRTEGALSDWHRMGTRRGVSPDEQVRSAWSIAGVPERGDTRALANVLLSTAGHAGRVADAARRNPALAGAARAAARRTVRRYTEHGADMASLGDVLGGAPAPDDDGAARQERDSGTSSDHP
uniref:Uncharacterized protein n=1 Tax=Neobacillus citreus TaxID=2833578 RepID=A0A942T9A9_9BACI